MEDKLFKFNSMMSNYEIVNPEFAKVKVYVCYAGKNRNRTEIPRDVLEDMSKTIYGIPVVAEYDKDNNCFKGHGGKLEVTDDSIEFIQTTVPYGFVDPTTPVFYETVTELDGITENEYLCCYAYLWYKRYPEVESVLKNQDVKPIGQSMEVEVEDYEMGEDDYFVFKKAHFSSLCLLGVEPCFESAKATSRFSVEDSKAIYQEMMKAFKSYTLKNFEEGGIEVEDNKELEIVETTEVAETEEVKAEVIEESVVEEVTENDEVEEAKEEEVKEDSEVEVETEPETVIEETEDFEHKYNEVVKELNELKAKYTDLKSDYDILQEENKELANFKLGIEKEQKDIELNSIFEKYSALNKVEGYSSLFEKRYELDEEELIKSLKVLAFDNNININIKNKKDFSKNSIKIPVVSVEKDINRNTAWDILEKHIK